MAHSRPSSGLVVFHAVIIVAPLKPDNGRRTIGVPMSSTPSLS